MVIAFWFLERIGSPEGIPWETYEDLKGVIIGSLRGNSRSKIFNETVAKEWIKHHPVASDEINIKKLISKRVDAIIWEGVPDNPLDFTEEEKAIIGSVKLNYSKKPFKRGEFCIGISKKSPLSDYIPELDEIIDRLRTSGKFDGFRGR